MRFLPYLVLALLLHCVSARLVNVTIDDQYGDPTNSQFVQYFPTEAWNVGQTCQACTAKPSPASDAYMGTWSDTTFYPSGTATNDVPGQIIQASVTFTGSAVYVMCILTGTSTSPDGNTDMTFKIDGATMGVFQQSPNGNPAYNFSVPVFATTRLSNSLHNLTIESGHAGKKALVLLDSIIYTTDDDSDNSTTSTSSTLYPSSSSATSGASSEARSSSGRNTAVIVGLLISAIVVVGAIIIALVVVIRRRRHAYGGVRVSLDSPAMATAHLPPPRTRSPLDVWTTGVTEAPSHSIACYNPGMGADAQGAASFGHLLQGTSELTFSRPLPPEPPNLTTGDARNVSGAKSSGLGLVASPPAYGSDGISRPPNQHRKS